MSRLNDFRNIVLGGILVPLCAIFDCAADSRYAVGPDAGAPPAVKVYTGDAGSSPLQSFFAYGPSFTGGVRVALGDIDGDGVSDLVTGAGAGAPHVKVFSGATGAEIRSFFGEGVAFTGGIYVAAGDVDGDGRADIIVGAGAASGAGAVGPHVRVFSGATGAVLHDFLAFGPTFNGGVRVAAGDVNGDGRADLVVGTGPGTAAHVRVFRGHDLGELHNFFPYDSAFQGGVFVAAGDVNGDDIADLMSGADASQSGPHVKVFDGSNLQLLRSFFAGTPSFTGGVRVAVGDTDSDRDDDLVTARGSPATPQVEIFPGPLHGTPRVFNAYDPSFTGGVFVAVAVPNDVILRDGFE